MPISRDIGAIITVCILFLLVGLQLDLIFQTIARAMEVALPSLDFFRELALFSAGLVVQCNLESHKIISLGLCDNIIG